MTSWNSGRGVYRRVMHRSADQPLPAVAQGSPNKALDAA